MEGLFSVLLMAMTFGRWERAGSRQLREIREEKQKLYDRLQFDVWSVKPTIFCIKLFLRVSSQTV
jgi:hypothetical protein